MRNGSYTYACDCHGASIHVIVHKHGSSVLNMGHNSSNIFGNQHWVQPRSVL